jgi:hypothetical protein
LKSRDQVGAPRGVAVANFRWRNAVSILEIRQQNEQTIDRHTIDDVLYAGFDAAAVEKARSKVQDFRAWIPMHKDELTALQVLYSGTRPLKLSRLRTCASWKMR